MNFMLVFFCILKTVQEQVANAQFGTKWLTIFMF